MEVSPPSSALLSISAPAPFLAAALHSSMSTAAFHNGSAPIWTRQGRKRYLH